MNPVHNNVEILRRNEELEEWVKERTRLLLAANEKLNNEIEERKLAEEQLRYQANLLANVSDAIISTDMAFRIKSWNNAAESIYGWSAAEAIGRWIGDIIPTEYEDAEPEAVLRQFLEEGQWRGNVIQPQKDGTSRYILSSVTLLRDEAGQPYGAVAVNRDITWLKQVEKENLLKDELLRMTGEMAKVGGWEFDTQTLQGTWTDEVARIHDMDPDEATNVEIGLSFYLPEYQERIEKAINEAIQLAKSYDLEMEMVTGKGRFKWVRTMGLPITDGERVVKVRGIFQDITESKKLKEEHEMLTAQFYHAQKMESIGRLAGGIAHDFNNLLVPIINNAELGMMNLAPEDQLYTRLKRILEAGQRAASLIHQILAFSRQQGLESKTLDLNEIISAIEPMLHRLIGEDIALQIRLADALPSLEADKGQLEQILLNLVVNARDAMPEGGNLVIETALITLDKDYVSRHAGAQPGPHIMLAVSDTGQGMDAATRQRIFEPFFTTKPVGEGTGLGLATVFGIVKQHAGNIWVYSEPGRGTTFKIYLPLTEMSAATAEPDKIPEHLTGGAETILLVEDEVSVRQLVSEILQEYGYQVLETGEPEAGLALAAVHRGPIHLLLTDVIMPQMNGRKLYEQLISFRPGLKVLYMSGYTYNVIGHHEVMNEETAFMQKPFTIEELLQKVRFVLG